MEFLKESDFRKEIKAKPGVGYFFFGEEDYMKSYALNTARELLCPDETLAFFNEIKLDSFTYSPAALLDALMPLPMMADRKLVTVTGLDFNTLKQKDIDALCETLSHLEEYDYNTLIISVASDRFDPGFLPKRPSSALTKLAELLKPVCFEKNTPARLTAWVGKHFEHNGVTASPAVCSFAVDRCGREMFNLASETDKVAYYVKAAGRDTVTEEDILRVTVPAAEYDAFAFTNAIGARRKEEALEILRDLRLRRTDPILIMSEITKTVCDIVSVITLNTAGKTSREIAEVTRLHEYRISLILRENLSLAAAELMLTRCREADLGLKGDSGMGGYGVLEKLICTI